MKFQQWLGPFHMGWRRTMHANEFLTFFSCGKVLFLLQSMGQICPLDLTPLRTCPHWRITMHANGFLNLETILDLCLKSSSSQFMGMDTWFQPSVLKWWNKWNYFSKTVVWLDNYFPLDQLLGTYFFVCLFLRLLLTFKIERNIKYALFKPAFKKYMDSPCCQNLCYCC